MDFVQDVFVTNVSEIDEVTKVLHGFIWSRDILGRGTS